MADTTMGTMIGYDFTIEGKHHGGQVLENDAQIGTWIRTQMARAFVQGREAMVTDGGDNAVLHVKDGQVLFAGGADTATFATNLRRLALAQQTMEGSVRDALGAARDNGIER